MLFAQREAVGDGELDLAAQQIGRPGHAIAPPEEAVGHRHGILPERGIERSMVDQRRSAPRLAGRYIGQAPLTWRERDAALMPLNTALLGCAGANASQRGDT